MKVAVLANLKEDAPVSKEDPPGRWDDLDDRVTVDAILQSLTDLAHRPLFSSHSRYHFRFKKFCS